MRIIFILLSLIYSASSAAAIYSEQEYKALESRLKQCESQFTQLEQQHKQLTDELRKNKINVPRKPAVGG